MTLRIRLAPLPDTKYTLRWRQRNAAYRVTSLADTVANLVPHGYNETLLYPVARYLFSGSTHFALVEGSDRKPIEEAYGQAMALLQKLGEAQQHVNQMADTTGGW